MNYWWSLERPRSQVAGLSVSPNPRQVLIMTDREITCCLLATRQIREKSVIHNPKTNIKGKKKQTANQKRAYTDFTRLLKNASGGKNGNYKERTSEKPWIKINK